jgi:hypothetical protein
MATVNFGNETYTVDDELLQHFMSAVLIDGEDMAWYLDMLKPEDYKALTNYLIYRLAEVNPPEEINART